MSKNTAFKIAYIVIVIAIFIFEFVNRENNNVEIKWLQNI